MPLRVQQPEPPSDDEQALIDCSPSVVLDRFDLGDYRLKPHHYERLLSVADEIPILTGFDLVLNIRGHTDKSGSERLNLGLSLSRAFEVFAYLQFFFGGTIPVETQVEGLGETSPIPGADAARNRRVELRFCRRPPRPSPPTILTAQGRQRARPTVRR